MKPSTVSALLSAAALAASLSSPVRAQDQSPAPATSASEPTAATSASAASSEDIQTLPTFEVTSEKTQAYVGNTALSSTRIAVDLSDLPQSIKVLNNSFLNAIKPDMASDILDYVGGGQNGQLNWTPGRMNIRGFTGDADYMDGFAPTAATALDENIFDRFEIVKGPNAIFLAADGSPGGIVNKITKSPSSTPETAVTIQTGRWDGNDVVLDTTGPITHDGKLAYRIVASGSYYNEYYDNTYMHRYTSLYALSYTFNPETKLQLNAELNHANWPSYNGLPVDPRTLQMINLPYDSTQDFGPPLNWRMDYVERYWGTFDTRLNPYTALSVRAMRAFDRADRLEAIAPTWTEGTTTGSALINGVSTPVTFLGGKWTTPASVGSSESVAPVNYYTQNGAIFVTDPWGGTPNYTGGAIPRSTINADDGRTLYNDLQADVNFNYSYKTWATDLLLIGFEHRDQPGSTITYKNGVSASAWYPYAEDTPGSMVTNYSAPSADVQTQSLQNRGYLLETLKVWDDRIIGDWGVTRASNYAGTFNYLTGAFSGVPYNINVNLVQWGAVIKVVPGVSLFTGFNENFAVNGTGTYNGVPNSVLPPKTGKQHEVGIKTNYFENKLQVDVSYFDIQQQNNTVPSFPFDPSNPNVLVPGVISRGFDGDFSYQITPQFFLMGSFANYSAKSILGSTYAASQGGRFIQPATRTVAWASIPVDNTAEQTESLYVLYKFNDTLRGLQFGLGENFQAKRAVTDGPNQVFWGYVPSRTVVDGMAQYKLGDHWQFVLTIDNLLDKKYIYAVRSEDVIVPGIPINPKFAITYFYR